MRAECSINVDGFCSVHNVQGFTLRGFCESGALERIEELRAEIRREEGISYGELVELKGLAKFIEPGDVEMLEWAGVPEFNERDI